MPAQYKERQPFKGDSVGPRVDCPALRKAALVCLTANKTKRQVLDEIGSRSHAMTANARLMRAEMYHSKLMPELKETSRYVVVGTYYPVFKGGPKLLLPSSTDTFFCVSTTITCVDLTKDDNFHTLFQNIHGVTISKAIANTSSQQQNVLPTEWLRNVPSVNVGLHNAKTASFAQLFRRDCSDSLKTKSIKTPTVQQEPSPKKLCLEISKTALQVAKEYAKEIGQEASNALCASVLFRTKYANLLKNTNSCVRG